MKYLVVIPARGGSKGIPKKNIYPLHGKPLIEYSLDVIQKVSFDCDVAVSSDSDEILAVAGKYKAVELIKRYKRTPAQKTFCYLDPPYYVKGRDLYLNYYTDDDHRAIAQAIKRYKGKWIISYDAVPFLKVGRCMTVRRRRTRVVLPRWPE